MWVKRNSILVIVVSFLAILPRVFADGEFAQAFSDIAGFFFRLLQAPYTVSFLILILFIIFFGNVLKAALSFVPVFKNNTKQMNSIATVLSFLFTLGLLGGTGFNGSSWSAANVTANINRVMTPFAAMAPWILGILIGMMVYFSSTQNNEPKGKRWAITLISFGLSFWVSQAAVNQSAAGSSAGLVIAGIGAFFSLFMREDQNGRLTYAGPFAKRGPYDRQGREARHDLEEKKKKQKEEKDDDKKTADELTHDEKKVSFRITEVSDYMNKEMEHLKELYDDKQKFNNLIENQLKPHINNIDSPQNRDDLDSMKNEVASMGSVIDSLLNDDKKDMKTEKRDKRIDRRIYIDIFKKIHKTLQKEKGMIDKNLKKLQTKSAEGIAIDNNLLGWYKDMQKSIDLEERLIDSDESVSMMKFLDTIEILHKRMRSQETEYTNALKEFDKIMTEMLMSLQAISKETDSQKKQEMQTQFYGGFDKRWQNAKGHFEKIYQGNKDLLQDINNLVENARYLKQLLLNLIEMNRHVEADTAGVEKILGEIEKSAENKYEEYNSTIEKFKEIGKLKLELNDNFRTIRDKFLRTPNIEKYIDEFLAAYKKFEEEREHVESLIQEKEYAKEKATLNDYSTQAKQIYDIVVSLKSFIANEKNNFYIPINENPNLSILSRDEIINFYNGRIKQIKSFEDSLFQEQVKAFFETLDRFFDAAQRYVWSKSLDAQSMKDNYIDMMPEEVKIARQQQVSSRQAAQSA